MPAKLKAVGRSDKGLVRPGNEDAFYADTTSQVFAVCDGMGGHQAGEVASLLAAEVIRLAFKRFRDELIADVALQLPQELPASTNLLLKAIRLANRAIYRRASSDSDMSGMGTTIVALALEGDLLTVAHVGDSRAYRLDDGELVSLTTDHSWVAEMQKTQQMSREEASSLVGKNIITRALGVREAVEVDFGLMKVRPGEIYILCSDGLCGFVEDNEIFAVAGKHRNDLVKMADSLVLMANDRGGMDNVTVIVLQVGGVSQSAADERPVMTLEREPEATLEAEDRWVERIEAEPPAEDSNGKPGKKGGAGFVIGLFAVFAVVAVLIIFLSQSN